MYRWISGKYFWAEDWFGLFLCSVLMLIVQYRLSPMLQSRRQRSMRDQHTEPVPRFGRFVKWTHHCCVSFFSNTLLFARSKCSAAVEFGAPWNNTRILDLQSSPCINFHGRFRQFVSGILTGSPFALGDRNSPQRTDDTSTSILAIPILDSWFLDLYWRCFLNWKIILCCL